MNREPVTDGLLRDVIAAAERGNSQTEQYVRAPEAASMATELLALRARDAQLQFAHNPQRGSVTICGTEFSVGLLERFRTNSGEDECYQHQRREDGLVIVVRTVGHREQIRLLRACIEARPRTADRDRFEEWSASAELALATTPDTIAAEARLVEQLIECGQAFRETARDPRMTSDDAATAEAGRTAQLEAAGRLFGALESVEFARRRLFLWDEEPAAEGYGTCAKCGCTDTTPCTMKNGLPCGWADETHTLCSACADEVMMPIEGGAE